MKRILIKMEVDKDGCDRNDNGEFDKRLCQTFKAGESYSLGEELAKVFIDNGWAKAVGDIPAATPAQDLPQAAGIEEALSSPVVKAPANKKSKTILRKKGAK